VNLKSLLLDFKYLYLMFGVVLVLSAASLAVSDYSPKIIENLKASSQNILGIFTYIFVHKDAFSHLMPNMAILFITLLFFSLTNYDCQGLNKKRKELFTVLAIWGSAILSSLFYVVRVPNIYVSGSSGLVSAMMGATTMFSSLNAWKQKNNRVSMIAHSIIALFLVIIFVLLNLTAGPDTNVYVHLTSFWMSLVFTLVYLITQQSKR